MVVIKIMFYVIIAHFSNRTDTISHSNVYTSISTCFIFVNSYTSFSTDKVYSFCYYWSTCGEYYFKDIRTQILKDFDISIQDDYIKKLDESILFEHRYSAENWISSSNPNTFSFYDTPITIDLYYQINENYK